MPDLGELGRGLIKGARSATDRAGDVVRRRHDNEKTDAAEPDVGAVDVPLADEPEEHADDSEVAELVEQLRSLVDSRRPPPGPITQRWSLGLGDLLSVHPKVPRRLGGLTRRFDRFGGIAITAETVAFDGDDVHWSDVTEVRTRHMVDYLLGDAVQQQQVENVPLPWFPGRKRVLDALGKAVLTITIATAEKELDDFGLDLRIPAEIGYRAAFGRRRTLSAGVLAAVVLAEPSVNRALTATAQARGIPVTAGDDAGFANAAERAAAIREKVAALNAELERFGRRFGKR